MVRNQPRNSFHQIYRRSVQLWQRIDFSSFNLRSFLCKFVISLGPPDPQRKSNGSHQSTKEKWQRVVPGSCHLFQIVNGLLLFSFIHSFGIYIILKFIGIVYTNNNVIYNDVNIDDELQSTCAIAFKTSLKYNIVFHFALFSCSSLFLLCHLVYFFLCIRMRSIFLLTYVLLCNE